MWCDVDYWTFRSPHINAELGMNRSMKMLEVFNGRRGWRSMSGDRKQNPYRESQNSAQSQDQHLSDEARVQRSEISVLRRLCDIRVGRGWCCGWILWGVSFQTLIFRETADASWDRRRNGTKMPCDTNPWSHSLLDAGEWWVLRSPFQLTCASISILRKSI